jgi:stage III sporulation protein AC
MNIDLIFRIAAIGILVSVLNAVLKKSDREEMAMMTSLAGLIIVLIMVIREIVKLFDEVKTIFRF